MTSHSFQDILSVVMRTGVLTSVAFMIVGVALIFITGKADGYTLSEISNLKAVTSTQLNSSMLLPADFLQGLIAFDGAYYIALGLWILIFTPVTVVVISILEYADVKNYRYILISIIVLINLFVAILVVR